MLLSVFASNWETGDHDGVKSNRECSNSIERWGTGQYLYILVLTIMDSIMDSMSNRDPIYISYIYPSTHHHGATLFEYQLTSGIQAV